MSVDKVILKAFLSTLGAIAALFLVMLCALVAGFPETMMDITYDMGMETPCIWFAERSYKRHDDIEVIALATSVAISEDNHKKVVSCGEKMIADNEFATYCAQKDEATAASAGDKTVTDVNGEPILLKDLIGRYDQYVYGQICLSKYELGDADGAIARAITLTEGFPRNNALAVLLISALERSDTATVETIKGKMNEMQSEVPEGDQTYFGEILALVQDE